MKDPFDSLSVPKEEWVKDEWGVPYWKRWDKYLVSKYERPVAFWTAVAWYSLVSGIASAGLLLVCPLLLISITTEMWIQDRTLFTIGFFGAVVFILVFAAIFGSRKRIWEFWWGW